MSRRKRLWRFGARPHTVSVFAETVAQSRYCRVQWRARGQLRTKSWPDTGDGRREAKAFAQTLAMELLATPAAARPIVTLGALWDAYQDAEFEALRPKTRLNYRAHWRAWELFAGRETAAQDVTRETLDAFRKELRRLDVASSQLRKHVELVKRVYRFGVDRELIPPSRLTDYQVKIAKEDRTPEGEEYSTEEALAIIGALRPEFSREWRSWVFCTIAHYTGARANAILHLRWDDVERDEAGQGTAVIWRAAWDKMGVERAQPIPRQVADALAVALSWRDRASHREWWRKRIPREGTTPWVLFSSKNPSKPMTYGGVSLMLRIAERRAGVAHVHGNAAHRFRRGIAGDVHERTGDAALAMQWIGDTDLKQAKRYLKRRDDRLRSVAEVLSSANSEGGPDGPPSEPAGDTAGWNELVDKENLR